MKTGNTKFNILQKLVYASCFTCVFSLFSQIYFSNKAVVGGDELQSLYNQKISLEKEIALLEYENSKLSSIAKIDSRARQLGFVELSGGLSTVTPLTLALLGTQ